MGDRPVQKWRIGNMEAALWENKKSMNGAEVTYWTVSLSRGYKKKDEGVWRSEVINNLRRNDIPKLIAILEKVQDHLFFEVPKSEREEEDEE
ncbi:MAG: hypothetical protein QW404_02510 [Candidatus Nanoarchaeia archaeon]